MCVFVVIGGEGVCLRIFLVGEVGVGFLVSFGCCVMFFLWLCLVSLLVWLDVMGRVSLCF